jgi:hypothetical protein
MRTHIYKEYEDTHTHITALYPEALTAAYNSSLRPHRLVAV